MKDKKIHKRILSPFVVKTAASAFAVIVQVALIVVSCGFLVDRIGPFMRYVNIVFEILSVLVVLYIIKSDINPVYKIPWMVVIMIFPLFGGVIYIVYGRYHFSKREIARNVRMMEKSRAALDSRPYYNDELKEADGDVYVQTEYLLNRADAPAYRNTTAQFFPLGEDMLPVMLEELEKAESFIFMEYFIIQEGQMLNPIIEILERKAAQGLEVRFMYDSFGSILKTPAGFVSKMRQKGIKCYEFNSFITVYGSRYNNRDHRKICVIDGNVGFTGGINLADEYINAKKLYGHWKDTAIMLKGEAVWSMTVMFLSLWDGSFRKADDFDRFVPTRKFDYDDGYFIPYTDYPIDEETVGKNVYLNLINRAKDHIYIMTPYLILDNVMVTALINAAKSGVDVRIITPGIPDKKIAFMLTRSYYEVLTNSGVAIYEYTPGFVHAKIFEVDDKMAVVGTINLDYRSLAHHYENAVLIYGSKVIEHIKDDYLDTMKKSRHVTYEESRRQSLPKRILLPILRLFSPLF